MNDQPTRSAGAAALPAVDFGGHLATIRLRKYPIVLAAVGVALVVLLLQLLTPPTYAADATARIDGQGAGGAAPADAASFAAQTVVGLAATPEVRTAAADGSGLGIGPAEAAARTSVTQTEFPGFLNVQATGPTPDDAAALADATVDALARQLVADRAATVEATTAPLRAQLADLTRPNAPATAAAEQRVAALVEAITIAETTPAPNLAAAPASAVLEPVSPTPWRDALLAFVVALIVIAEGVVLVRAIRGRLSEAEPAAQVTATLGVPAAEADRGGDPATALAPLYRAHLRPESGTGPAETGTSDAPLVAVQLGRPRSRDLARDLAGAAALAGDDLELQDPGTPRPSGDRALVRVRGARLDADLMAQVRDARGPVVLVVDTASTSRRQLEGDVLALRAVGAEVAAVVVWRGRPPREKRGEWPTTPATESVEHPEPVESDPRPASPVG